MHFSFISFLAIVQTAVAAPGWGDWQSSLYASSTTSTAKTTTRPDPTTSRNTTSISITKATTTTSASKKAGWDLWANVTSPLTSTRTSTRTVTNTIATGWTSWGSTGGSGGYSNPSGGRPGSSDQYYSSSDVVENNGWDEWYNQPPLISVDAPVVTLVPVVHWSVDKTNSQNIIPCDCNSFYYGTDGETSPNKPHRMAWIHANFTSTAVVLGNSDLLTYDYTPSSQSLSVIFKDKTAFDLARTSWTTDQIMITNDGKCGNDGLCYLKIVQLSFDESVMTCRLSISAIDFETAISYFDYEWGLHQPAKPASQHSSSTTSSKGVQSPTDTSGLSFTVTNAPKSTTSGTSLNTTTSSIYAGNYTVDNVDEVNCTAPADGKTGLPAACFGDDFDEDIDDKYGYTDYKDPAFGNFVTQFNDVFLSDPTEPDAEDETIYAMDEAALGLNEDMDIDFTKRHAKRIIGRLLPKKWRKKLAKLIPIKGVTTPLKIEKKLLKLNMVVPKKRKTQASPWGQQVLIKSAVKDTQTTQGKIEIFCVDCGVEGRAEIFGRAGVSVLNGLETLGVRLEFNLALTLKVGIDAQIVYSQTFTQHLFKVPLTKTCVGPIICAGPVINVGTDLILTAKAEGRLLAGATVAINNAKADLELIPPKVTASGWGPEFRPVFEASGSIDLTADFGVPVALALELSVLSGKFKRDIALVNRPALVAKAAVAASASLDSGKLSGGIEATNGCNGIATTLDLKNDIYVKLPNDKRINVVSVPPKNLKSHCIPLTKSQKPAIDGGTQPAGSTDTTGQTTSGQDTTVPKGGDITTPDTASGPSIDTSTPTNTDSTTDPKTDSPGTETVADTTTEQTATNPTKDTDTESAAEPISRVRRGTFEYLARDDTASSSDSVTQESTPTTDGSSTQSVGSSAATPAGQPTGSDSTESTSQVTTTAQNSYNEDTRDTTAEDQAKGTDMTTDFVTPKHGDQAYDMTNGYSIVTLTDTLSNYQLHACEDGNLHLLAVSDDIPDYECGSGFTMVTSDGIVMADAMSRIPIYYPDEMEKLGFSRFRVASDRAIPKGSKEIVLIPSDTEMENGDTATLYYPMTPDSGDGVTFYPVVCKYADDQPDKLFLAADAENAIAGLLNPDLRATLTGGEIAECWNMPMVKGKGNKAKGENDWLSDQTAPTTNEASAKLSTTATVTDSENAKTDAQGTGDT